MPSLFQRVCRVFGPHAGNAEKLDDRPGDGCLQTIEFPKRPGSGDLVDLPGYPDTYARDTGEFLLSEFCNREREPLDLPRRPLVSPGPVPVISRDLEQTAHECEPFGNIPVRDLPLRGRPHDHRSSVKPYRR